MFYNSRNRSGLRTRKNVANGVKGAVFTTILATFSASAVAQVYYEYSSRPHERDYYYSPTPNVDGGYTYRTTRVIRYRANSPNYYTGQYNISYPRVATDGFVRNLAAPSLAANRSAISVAPPVDGKPQLA